MSMGCCSAPLAFTTLPQEVYLDLAKFLPLQEVRALSQTCAHLREVFRAASWRVCEMGVYLDDEDCSSELLRNGNTCDPSDKSRVMRLNQRQVFPRDTMRSVPMNVLCDPDSYSWFMPQHVVHLDLGRDYKDVPLDAYPALQSVHVTIDLQGSVIGKNDRFPWDHDDPSFQFVEQTTCDPRLARIARIVIGHLDLGAHLQVPIPGLETTARVVKLDELQMPLYKVVPLGRAPLVLRHVTSLKLNISDQITWFTQLFESLSQWESLSSLTLAVKPYSMPWSRIRNLAWFALLAKVPTSIRNVYLLLSISGQDQGRDGDAYATLEAPITFPAVTDFILFAYSRFTTIAEDLKLPRLKVLQLREYSSIGMQAQFLETWANCSDSLTRLELRLAMVCYEGTIVGLRKLDRLKRLRITEDRAHAGRVCGTDEDAPTKTIVCGLLDAISRGAPISEDSRHLVRMLETVVTDPCMALAQISPKTGTIGYAVRSYSPMLCIVYILEAIYDTVLNYLPALEYLAVHYHYSYLTSPALARLLAATLSDDPPQSVAVFQQIRLVAFECDSADTAKFERLPTHPAMLHTLFLDEASVLYDLKEKRQFARYYPKAKDGDAVKLAELTLSEEEEAEMMTDEFDGWVY